MDRTVRMPVKVRVLVFKATINNMSIASCRSLVLVEETGVPGENQSCCTSMTNFFTHSCGEYTSL